MDKETQSKINQLQLLEQNISNLSFQKQNFQAQLTEVESALDELKNTQGLVFKIVGPMMIHSTKDKLEKELNEKKEIILLRIKTLEKQENQIQKKAKNLQEEVVKEIK